MEFRPDIGEPRPGTVKGRGNEHCAICRALRIRLLWHCGSCDLKSARQCPPLRASFLIIFGTLLVGLAAHLMQGTGNRIIFVATAAIAIILLLWINSARTERLRTRERLAQLRREMAEQHEFLKELSPIGTMQECLEHIIESAAQRLRCRRVSILLLDGSGRFLRIAAARGVPEPIVRQTRIPVGERVSGQVFLASRFFHVNGDDGPPRSPLPIEARAFMSGPLLLSGMRWGNVRLGVLSVTEPLDRDDFSLDDEFVFSNICEASAVAIYNHQAMERIKRAHLELLQTLVNAVEARDKYTRGHSERVSQYALAIGRRLGLDDSTLAQLSAGGRLHDIGKIGMTDAILYKRTAPTEEEWQRIRLHPDTAVRMLADASLAPVATEGIRCHHERLDGSGYPRGLKGQEIPDAARIIGVADAFDAMTTARPYHQPMPFENALAELLRDGGKKFDPACVAVLVDAAGGGELKDIMPAAEPAACTAENS